MMTVDRVCGSIAFLTALERTIQGRFFICGLKEPVSVATY